MKKIKIILLLVFLLNIFTTSASADNYNKYWTGKTITYSGTTVASNLYLKQKNIDGTLKQALETDASLVNIYYKIYNSSGTLINTLETAYKGKGTTSTYSFETNGMITNTPYNVKAKRQNFWDSGLLSNGSITQ